jgi:hypothetical protein
VKHAPNFFTYMMEDSMPALVFQQFGSERLVSAFLIVFILLAIAVAAAGAWAFQR